MGTVTASIPVSGTGLTAKFLPTITNQLNGAAGNSAPTGAPPSSNSAETLKPVASAAPSISPGDVATAFKDIVRSDLEIIEQLTTVINGISTTLPVVSTTLNGQTTALPLINTVVNGVTMGLPLLNEPVGQLAGSVDMGEARRKLMRRGDEGVWHEVTFCEGLPDHESCD
jgi:hypothetical protein